MKRLLFLAMVLSYVVWAGCSNKDDGGGPVGPGPGSPARVVANDTIGAPTMISADEPVWDFVAKFAVDVSTLNAPKLTAPASLNAPDSVYVQAITNPFEIYLRVEYTDDSLNLLRDFMVTRDNQGNFNISRFSQEDQVYIMFAGLPNGAYDVWNWRSLTTGSAGLAEGFVYANDSLVRDSGTSQVAFENFELLIDSLHPIYVDSMGVNFAGQVLYKWNRDLFSNRFSSYLSPGRIVPGWWVDDSLGYRVSQTDSSESRWDVFTVHSHSSSANKMAVVFRGRLFSPFSDDLDLADSVKVKIGIFDDQSDFNQSSSRRGFTQEFWLIL